MDWIYGLLLARYRTLTTRSTICAASIDDQSDKNQGYEFEHNYAHGKQYLSGTLAEIMLLTFLTDQLQKHDCQLFKAALKQARVQKKLRERMRSILDLVWIPDVLQVARNCCATVLHRCL